MTWDMFVSHASDDKSELVRPLVQELVGRGLSVWFDELSLRAGDRLSESIDRGLAESSHAVVVLSPAYLRKDWTRHELAGLLQRFIARRMTLIPIWHRINHDEVIRFSPSIADVVALRSEQGVPWLVQRIVERVGGVGTLQAVGLREVLAASVDIGPESWFRIVSEFQLENRLFQVVRCPSHIDDRTWQYFEEDVCHLNVGDVTYFTVRVIHSRNRSGNEEWDLGFHLTLLAALPLMDTLIRRFLELLPAGRVEAG